jgi:hypothetical protein
MKFSPQIDEMSDFTLLPGVSICIALFGIEEQFL